MDTRALSVSLSSSAWNGSPWSDGNIIGIEPARARTPSRHGRRFVHEQPEEPELLDRLDELFELHWLYDVGVYAELIALDHVALLARGRQDDDRHALEGRICL